MEPDSSSRKQAVAISYIFAAGIGVVLLQWAFATYSQVDTIPFSANPRGSYDVFLQPMLGAVEM
jgi:hypothetical protein